MPEKNKPTPQVRQPLGELPAYNIELEQEISNDRAKSNEKQVLCQKPPVAKFVETTPYPPQRL